MTLDDFSTFRSIDLQNMLGEIDALPEQLRIAWELGQSQPSILKDPSEIKQVMVAGMGGSAIGADLLTAYIASTCPVPVIIHRDYGVPAWAQGSRTLVIASSHSGNTEETLNSFDAALANHCQVLVIATGGKLSAKARENGVPVWNFEHLGQPRAAVGFSFGLLLAAFARLGFIPDPAGELAGAVAAMTRQQENLKSPVPVAENPAKRLAGQLVGRWVNVYGSGVLAPVARRWKGQIGELAKAGAGFEILPEADHNALAGLLNPEETLSRTLTLFLCALSDHPRNALRSELTRRTFMTEGLNTDAYQAQGDSPLAHMWTSLHFGDYAAYYLAMMYGVDPTPIEALVNFKNMMTAAK